MDTNHTAAIFTGQLILLLFVGRMIGEGMSRIGQPSIFGQLIAGIILGPSVFGALLPVWHHAVFPDTPTLKSMIDALSQIGILLLLLLTGMETNFALVNRRKRAVMSTSVFGIAVPFACGVALTYTLPAELIPKSGKLLVTALFVGTALSISSVKIVAMVLMEVGAVRRDLGQLILATAILDDTIAWVIIAIISGLASKAQLDLSAIGMSLLGTTVFLGLSFTAGRRVVSNIIRWTNDTLVMQVPVITAILLIMLAMALTTELIGVHTALGAFVAGMLIGQSPILTEHIEGQLRGFILAFFSPIFFAVAGLGMDLRTLMQPSLIGFTVAIILVATIGKFVGAAVGGKFGGLTGRQSLALATGLNARGSTEVIIASIGLSMGVLSNQLYTMIVAMAVITTLAMPPTLRWMLARLPMSEDEAKRLEKEQAEEHEAVPKMERSLVYLDTSANALLAARLAGAFATSRQVVTTVTQANAAARAAASDQLGIDAVRRAATAALNKVDIGATADATDSLSLNELVHAKALSGPDGIEREAAKGYDIAFVGIEQPISKTAQRFDPALAALVAALDGPVIVALNGEAAQSHPGAELRILVPTGGTSNDRLATEIALAIAKTAGNKLTVLHVFVPAAGRNLLRGRVSRRGMRVLVDARQLGQRSGVHIDVQTRMSTRPEIAIQRALEADHFDLVVLGASLRSGGHKFLGPGTEALVLSVKVPIVLVAE